MSTRHPHPLRAPHLIDARAIRGGREELRIELSEYRGFTYVGLRRWYRDEAGDWKPGKGLSVTADLIPWLRVGLEQAECRALELNLLDEESYESAGLALPVALTG